MSTPSRKRPSMKSPSRSSPSMDTPSMDTPSRKSHSRNSSPKITTPSLKSPGGENTREKKISGLPWGMAPPHYPPRTVRKKNSSLARPGNSVSLRNKTMAKLKAKRDRMESELRNAAATRIATLYHGRFARIQAKEARDKRDGGLLSESEARDAIRKALTLPSTLPVPSDKDNEIKYYSKAKNIISWYDRQLDSCEHRYVNHVSVPFHQDRVDKLVGDHLSTNSSKPTSRSSNNPYSSTRKDRDKYEKFIETDIIHILKALQIFEGKQTDEYIKKNHKLIKTNYHTITEWYKNAIEECYHEVSNVYNFRYLKGGSKFKYRKTRRRRRKNTRIR